MRLSSNSELANEARPDGAAAGNTRPPERPGRRQSPTQRQPAHPHPPDAPLTQPEPNRPLPALPATKGPLRSRMWNPGHHKAQRRRGGRAPPGPLGQDRGMVRIAGVPVWVSPSELIGGARAVLGWTDEAVGVVAALPQRLAALLDDVDVLLGRVDGIADQV